MIFCKRDPPSVFNKNSTLRPIILRSLLIVATPYHFTFDPRSLPVKLEIHISESHSYPWGLWYRIPQDLTPRKTPHKEARWSSPLFSRENTGLVYQSCVSAVLCIRSCVSVLCISSKSASVWFYNRMKVGWGLVRTNVLIQWNPVYKAFYWLFFKKMNQLFGSNPNVILTRQTCGQRSNRVAGAYRVAGATAEC